MLTAGVSAPILTADKLDTKLDYDSIQAAGSMLGSASLIVLDETVCIVRAAHDHGGVLPPRVVRQVHALSRRNDVAAQDARRGSSAGQGRQSDLDLLLSLSGEISGKVLCALGDFATSPVVATVKQVPRGVRATHRARALPVRSLVSHDAGH